MKKNNENVHLRVAITTIIFITFLAQTGCGSQQSIQTTATPEITLTSDIPIMITSTDRLGDVATETQEPEPTNDFEIPPLPVTSARTYYEFSADLNYIQHSLTVLQTIQYQNNTGVDLSEIKLVVPPNQKENVFSLETVVIDGAAGLSSYSLNGITLTLKLDSILAKSDYIFIEIVYILYPPLQGGVLGYTAKRMNFSDWYPFIPPYRAENGWIIHQPSDVGEFLVYDKADFQLNLFLIKKEGLIVAGSTEVAPVNLSTFIMIAENARNLTFSVSDQYSVLTNSANGITVKGYVFPGDEVAGQAAVDYTANALQLYSELFGLPYPHKTLSVVESDFPDGMEYDGLYYLSDFYFKLYDGTFQNYLALLSVHENAHQWWFGVVANDQALEPWLDESLATYSEYLYIERYYPELTNWWWDYRVAYYKPAGRVNLTIYDQSDLRTYINAVYLQGAVFLDKLRQELGDEVFFDGLQSFVSTYNHQISTWDDFIKKMAPDPSDAIMALLNEYLE